MAAKIHPVRYSDADALLAHYPHLSQDQAKKLAKLKARPLYKEEAKEFLSHYLAGYTVQECCEYTQVPIHSVTLSRAIDRGFAKKLQTIEKNRKYQVEAHTVRYCTGKLQSTKTIYTAMLDDEGVPLLDEKNQPKWKPWKKEVTTLPAPPALIMYFLKHNYPEKYSDEVGNETPLSPAEVEQRLDEAAKRLLK